MISRRHFTKLSAAMFCSLVVAGCAEWEASPLLKAQHLVDESVATVERFQTIESLQRFSEFLPEAAGLMIFPRILKAGLFVGGEGGNGILMARNASGGWSAPAFYTMGTGSFGLQIGAQDTEMIWVIRNPGAVDAILKDQAKFGADAGFTAGVYGVGAEASTTTNLNVDVLAFTNSRIGGYIGVSVEGALIARRQDLNEGVYGADVTPAQIVSDPNVRLARADRLHNLLAR